MAIGVMLIMMFVVMVVMVVVIIVVVVIVVVIIMMVTVASAQCGNFSNFHLISVCNFLVSIEPACKHQPSALLDVTSINNVIIHFANQVWGVLFGQFNVCLSIITEE
jgi:hypothetical protein